MPNCDERFFHALPSRHRYILRYSVIPPEIKDAIFFLRGNCRRIFFLTQISQTLFHYFHIQNSINFVEKFSTRKINYPGDFRDNRFFFFLLIRFFEWMDAEGEFFWSIPTHTHTPGELKTTETLRPLKSTDCSLLLLKSLPRGNFTG